MSIALAPSPVRFQWSYSQLTDFETCARRYSHKYVFKDFKEEESSFMREGQALHEAFYARINGDPLRFPHTHHEPIFRHLDSKPGKQFAELKLALKRDFTPCAWMARDTWFRGKIDFLKINGFHATVIDWKSGKEKEDMTQLELMAALVFAHNPTIHKVASALAFVSSGHWERTIFGREDLTRIWAGILPRVDAMERAKAFRKFPPRPSGLCKRYCFVTSCDYHGKGSE